MKSKATGTKLHLCDCNECPPPQFTGKTLILKVENSRFRPRFFQVAIE
jgi:hypothetical protein